MRVRRNSTQMNARNSTVSSWRIPLSDINYGPEEEAAVLRVLRSKWLSMGSEVQAFEKEFAEMVGCKHAFAITNATAGLHLALKVLGVGPGDEVIQPAMNFVAAANMTVAVGATPVFADIVALDEPTIDPAAIERCITPRTKAVIVMHYGGYLCRMGDISAICRGRGIAIIEDACHAVGARYTDDAGRSPSGRMAGDLGDVSAFSFFANKNLVTGEGGMIATNRDDLAKTIKLLRSHGMTTLTWDRHEGHANSYDVVMNGLNYRLDELHAALGRVQLQKLDRNNSRRLKLTREYWNNLKDLRGWVLPFSAARQQGAGHLMCLVAPDASTKTSVVDGLRSVGVQTSMHYPTITSFEVFKSQARMVPLSDAFSNRSFTLPMFPTLQVDDVKFIAECIGKATH